MNTIAMTVASTFSRAKLGVIAPLVTVEADITAGLPQIVIVGLPETAVKESKDRVKAALINSGFRLPSRRVTINLAPADLPKQGGRYDLAIALSLLAASEQISASLISDREFLGELSLGGELRGIDGVLPAVMKSQADGRPIIVPEVNRAEASLVQTADVAIADSLFQTIQILKGEVQPNNLQQRFENETKQNHAPKLLSDIQGQYLAKRALTIAASGGHNMLMVGPPGTGKTMLASRLPDLLPVMSDEEALSSAAIQSVSKINIIESNWKRRPFRTPHHTASAVALVGGGNPPLPGEISLSHHGVLFLDELAEFSRHVLEVLREPLESGKIVISRAHHQVTYPARFQLVAAMNPCPCGYFGDESGRCHCRIDQIERYRGKISGPLLDRIDLHVKVPALEKGVLTRGVSDADLNAASQRETLTLINQARTAMLARAGKPNAHLNSVEIKNSCQLNSTDKELLEHALEKLGLSARGYFKVLKVARTIADLSGEDCVSTPHIVEALAFRDNLAGLIT